MKYFAYSLHFFVLMAVLVVMLAMSSIWAWVIWLICLCMILFTYFFKQHHANIKNHLFELIKIQIITTLALLVLSCLYILVLWGMGVAVGWNDLEMETFNTKWFYVLRFLTGLAYIGVGIWMIWRLGKNIRHHC